MRIKTWTGLRRKSKARPVFDRAERAKGYLDPLLVVPADVRVDHFNELLDGRALPVPRIAQRLDRGGDAAPVLGVVFDSLLLLNLRILRLRTHVAGRQVQAPLVLLMPAFQRVLRRVAQLADSRPGALAQLDVERDRSDAVFV